MALSAGTVSIAVKPDTANFGSTLKSGLLGGTAGAGEGVGSLILGGLKKFAGPIAAVAAGFSVKHFIDESVHAFEDLAGSVKTMQRITGGSVEAVSGLRGAMQLAGVDTSNITGAITIFSKKLGLAAQDSKQTAAMSDLFGQSIKDANGHVKSMADLLPGLADKFKEMPNGAEKTALATQLFGRAGAQLIPVLNKGSEGIAELTQKAKDMGLVLDDTAMKSFSESRESARNFAAAIQGLKVSLGEDLLPIIEAIQNTFRNAFLPALKAITGFLQEHREDFAKFGEILSGMGKGADGFKAGLDNITKSITDWISGGGITNMIQHFVEIRTKIVSALVDSLPSIITGIVGALTTAIPEIISSLLAMIPTLLQTAQTLFGALIIGLSNTLPKLVSSIANMLPQIANTIVSMLPGIISAALDLFMGLVQGLIVALPKLITAILDALPPILTALVTMLPGLVTGAVQLFLGLVTGLTTMLPQLINTLVNVVLPRLISTIITLIPVLIPAAVTLFLALITGLTKALPAIITAVIGLIPVIVKALISAIPQLIDAGFQLVKGLVKGIIDNGPTLISSAIKGMADLAVNTFKSLLGIHSPSTVFHDMGMHITRGLANGLNAGIDMVADAMGEITDVVTAPVTASANVSANGGLAGSFAAAGVGTVAALTGGSSKATTIIYNAAPNDSISAEQKLVDAVQRAKVLGAIA